MILIAMCIYIYTYVINKHKYTFKMCAYTFLYIVSLILTKYVQVINANPLLRFRKKINPNLRKVK